VILWTQNKEFRCYRRLKFAALARCFRSRKPSFVKLAGISKTNLNHIENGSDPRRSTLETTQAALEAKGIEFLDDNGMRLRMAK
jgi:hypothetical protein